MKTIFQLTVLLLSGVIVSSCVGPFTIENSGSSVNLGNDDPFEIELSGNPSTGYTWQVVSFDSTVIKQVGDPVYKASSDRIGSAGMYTFKFQTIADGQTNLLLVYKRKWEEHTLHDKTFEMKIVVGTMGRILED
ncbi:MAG: protease inhibitor I42 family protein [Bacteroidetes bacterium]|nr:protease inhibitor I42 family protein [Bacteroidota bacterium]